MITYMDRVVISSAVPSIQKEFGFSMVTMGWILSSFQWGYALFQIPGGWLGDRLGPRRALTLVVTWWSIFCSATALAWSAASMAVMRLLFGIGEAGAFPIATRSLSRWMLPSERGFAQGITHAGSRLGGALTPALVAVLIAGYGWRTAFVCFGSLGIVWASVWFWYYRDSPAQHRGVNEAERLLIETATGSRGAVRASVPWRRILSSRQMWLICAMYFCYAYDVSIYLAWFPKYLQAHRGFSTQQMGLFASLPLLAGTLGDALGGTLSDIWARRAPLNIARRGVAIFGFLLAALSMIPACLTADPMLSVALSCVAMFGLELTVGVSWAIPLDIGGDAAGSVAAVMNTFGNMGGATASALSAYFVQFYGWSASFLVMSALAFIGAGFYTRIKASTRLAL
jgi:MFS family permease